VLLVRFGSQNDEGAPGATALANPVIAEQCVDMLHNDFGLVGPVMRFLTANRSGSAGVDSKFPADNTFPGAVLIKTIPVALDDGADFSIKGGVDRAVDTEASKELIHISGRVKETEIVVDRGGNRGRLMEGCAILREHEYVIIEFRGEVSWYVRAFRFGSPDFRRDVDHKVRTGGKETDARLTS